MSDTVTLLDVHNRVAEVKTGEILTAIITGRVEILGMSILTISALRAEYMKLGGREPITKESVRALFAQRQIDPNAMEACPECQRPSQRHRRTYLETKVGEFYECPYCHIGSPVAQWNPGATP